MKPPFYECPQFDACSAPLCPLDPDAAKRTVNPGDPKCVAARRTREGIAARYPELLPNRGLNKRELQQDAAREVSLSRWLALPAEVRQARMKNLVPFPHGAKTSKKTPPAASPEPPRSGSPSKTGG